MRFRTERRSQSPAPRAILYWPGDYAFSLTPFVDGVSWIVINELTLGVDTAGKIVSVSGFCPHIEWKPTGIGIPESSPLDVYMEGFDWVTEQGNARDLQSDRRWLAHVDDKSGWLRFDSGREGATNAEVFCGFVLSIDSSGELVKVYLKPRQLPKV